MNPTPTADSPRPRPGDRAIDLRGLAVRIEAALAPSSSLPDRSAGFRLVESNHLDRREIVRRAEQLRGEGLSPTDRSAMAVREWVRGVLTLVLEDAGPSSAPPGRDSDQLVAKTGEGSGAAAVVAEVIVAAPAPPGEPEGGSPP